MEKFIRSIYTESILHKAMSRYGFEENNFVDINGFQSFVYECKKNGRNYVLRITHSSHRSVDLIQSELHWIHYLVKNGISACKPILSAKNRFIEIIELETSYFAVVAFEKAKGKYIPASNWGPSQIQKLGQITGKMHSLSKNYNPPHNFVKRLQWFEVDNYNVDKHLPSCQVKVKNKLHTLLKKISTFPRDRDSFGLIHADLRAENMSIDQEEITIFDFDGCIYSWFMHDIAITLFTAIRFSYDINDRELFVRAFVKNFLKGYNIENSISHTWWSEFQDFLLLEEIGEYNLIHRSCDLNNLDALNRQFMDKRRDNIENNVPYIDLNFCEEFCKN